MKRLMVLLTMWFGVLPAVLAAVWSPGCISPIAIGQPASGQLTASDCYWNYTLTPQHRYYTDVYSFSGTAGQQVSVLLTSPTLDMYVEIYNVNDFNATPLAADDNGGGGLNARIPAGSGLFTLPASGTYYIWVQTVDPDWTGAYTLTLAAASAVPPPAATPNVVTVTEFYHPVFNHYFITAYPEEAASLTAGNLPPWVPTGNTFKVWDAAGSGITNVCRFFSNQYAPRSSHFYSHDPKECPSLPFPGWGLESANAFYVMPTLTGNCPTGTVPLYRLYNNGMSGAPNHRYTTSQAVRTSMIAANWQPEGYGDNGVFACVPPGGSSPPPPTSAFQAEVTGYANTVLGLLSGNAIDIDQLLLILGAALESLETPSTCPATTSNPPIQGLDTFPLNLTITSSFGEYGCTVPGTSTRIGGSLVITVSKLVVSESGITGSVAVAFNRLSVNGVAVVAEGAVAAELDLVISGGFAKSAQRAALSIPRITGTVTVTLTGLQLPNGIGASGTATITLDTTGTTRVSTDITTTPHGTSPQGVEIKLNASVTAQPDGSVLVNTTGASSVGPYTVSVEALAIDTEVCASSPKGGKISFTKGTQTGVLEFNASCNYTYTGP